MHLLQNEFLRPRANSGNAFGRSSQVADEEHHGAVDVLTLHGRGGHGGLSRRRRQGIGGRRGRSGRRRIVDAHEIAVFDLLRLAVQEHAEIGSLQIGHRIAMAVGDSGVDLHQVDGDAQAILLLGDRRNASESRQDEELPHMKLFG